MGRAVRARIVLMRILGLIPFAAIGAVLAIYSWLLNCYRYLRYGGEAAIYDRPQEHTTIVHLFDEVTALRAIVQQIAAQLEEPLEEPREEGLK